MQKRQNSLYHYLVLSDKTLIATKLETLVFTNFQDFLGFVGSPWENYLLSNSYFVKVERLVLFEFQLLFDVLFNVEFVFVVKIL